MNLALTEMRRSKLKFGLLCGAVALLVFLVLFLTTLSTALVSSITGALSGVRGEVLVYSESARDNLQGSRLEPTVVDKVAKVDGVAEAGSISLTTTSAELKDGSSDLQLFGMTAEAPGAPTGLVSGRLPETRDEIAMDGGGYSIGDVVTLSDTEQDLEVVGLLKGAQFNASPTGYVDAATFENVVRAANPNVPFVPINGVAVTVAPGAEPSAVAAAVADEVSGTTGYTKEDAVSKIPGVGSISQTFGILVGLTFIIGIVVIGFFFLILTVQKMRAFTLLRAIGSSTAQLSGVVAVQITAVVVIAGLIAVLLTYGAVTGLSTGIPVALSPVLVGGTLLAVLAFSLIAGLLSIRRIARIDPATAAGAR
ncbi:MAG: ABC transporter permease [Candidatus Nanopelagicales bacterium]